MSIEVLFFYKWQVGVALHLSQRLFSCNELFCIPIVDFTLVQRARCCTHHTQVAVIDDWIRRQVVLATSCLPHCGWLMWLHDVTVIRQVGVMSTTLVLQRLYGSSEVYLTFEEFFAWYFVQFLGWLANATWLSVWVLLSAGDVLGATELQTNFVTSIWGLIRIMLPIPVEIWNVTIVWLGLLLLVLCHPNTTNPWKELTAFGHCISIYSWLGQ